MRHPFIDLCELHDAIWDTTHDHKKRLAVQFNREFSRRKVAWDKFEVIRNLMLRIGWRAMDIVIEQVKLALNAVKKRA